MTPSFKHRAPCCSGGHSIPPLLREARTQTLPSVPHRKNHSQKPFCRPLCSIWRQTGETPTRCFCSSVRTSLRTLAHGMSSGHQMGLQLSLPQPGFPRPVEYFSISGMKALSCAWNKEKVERCLGIHISGSFEVHCTELLCSTSILLELEEA